MSYMKKFIGILSLAFMVLVSQIAVAKGPVRPSAKDVKTQVQEQVDVENHFQAEIITKVISLPNGAVATVLVGMSKMDGGGCEYIIVEDSRSYCCNRLPSGSYWCSEMITELPPEK